MHSKSSVVSDRPGGYAQTLILPLKTLMRKRASRCLLLKWSVKKLIIIIIIIIIII
jgi:hypothetical protein